MMMMNSPVQVAKLIRKHSILLGGLSAWTVYVVALGSLVKWIANPFDLVYRLASYLSVPVLDSFVESLLGLDRWRQGHAEGVALASWLLGLAALAVSYAFLFNGKRPDNVLKGPAFAWICIAALTQVGFFPTGEVVRAVAPILLVTVGIIVYVIRKKDPLHRSALEGLAMGTLVMIPLWPLILLSDTIAGPSDRSSSASDVKVG